MCFSKESFMRNKERLACLTALMLGAAAAVSAETVVIVNPKNPASALTAEQVAAIYLGNSQKFPDGGGVALADQPDTAPVRAEFYEKATGRTPAQVKAVWARIAFTGKGTPPKELKTDADVKAFVASRPDAIGYVDASAVDGSVKAVLKL
jgi:ABC-type phosphate transport system substrate-binding protein